MSIIIETFLVCDGDCRQNFGVDAQYKTGKQHRQDARKEGWIVRNNKDYCCNCKSNPKFKTKTNPNER